MIKSEHGTVELSAPNYELGKRFHMDSSEVDSLVETCLRTDLTVILHAFILRYGLNKALDIWFDAIQAYADSQKGE